MGNLCSLHYHVSCKTMFKFQSENLDWKRKPQARDAGNKIFFTVDTSVSELKFLKCIFDFLKKYLN